MYTLMQSLELAAAEYEAKESEPTPVWQLAKCANIHQKHMVHLLKKRGLRVWYDDRSVAHVSKADARKLMGLEDAL